MAVRISDQPDQLTETEVSLLCEQANSIIAAAVRVRSAALSRNRVAADAELSRLRDETDEAITRMETAGLPWSPQNPAPLRSLEELHQAGLLPTKYEDPADAG